MVQWAAAPETREQLVLFTQCLDNAIARDHTVRLLDELLGRVSWTDWERTYHGVLGQPPIHPRILCSVILYGMLTQVRSSRKMEEALRVRLDFRWLVSGRTIDHTTLSEFRRKHPDELKGLFIKVCQVARELGFLNLQRLGYDATRVRANNRRSGTRTAEELKKERGELAAKFDELNRQSEVEDTQDEELFEAGSTHVLPAELQDQRRRLEQLDAALKELDRLAEEGRSVPQRIPVTDLESRVMPNKDGGHAPNYTPFATVDIDSGMIVDEDVLNVINEDGYLIPSIRSVQQNFQLTEPSDEGAESSTAVTRPLIVMTDSLNGTGANLAACEAGQINLISPCLTPDPATNPALRSDPTQPVPESQWDQLPTHTIKKGAPPQLDKSAFVYDAQRDCYWCPMGQPMKNKGTTSEKSGSGRRYRTRYKAEPSACADCPLRSRCVYGNADSRQINREQYEEHRERHAAKMARPESKDLYKLRRHAGERPFAMIKQYFGLRQFLLRGLDRVRTEWCWATTAFNLHRLMSLICARPGPQPN